MPSGRGGSVQIVMEDAGRRREVDLLVEAPGACVADLLRAAGAEPGGVFLGGRFFGPEMGLDEIGLHDGALVRVGAVGEGDPDWAPAGLVLALTDGPAAGRIVPLHGELLLGRDESCDLVLPDPTVSQRHLAMALRGDGTVVVTDLGSHNGTWIDGEAVHEATVLAPGAVLRLGATHARLVTRLPEDRPLAVDPLYRAVGGLVPFNRPPRPPLPEASSSLRPPQAPRPPTRSRALSLVGIVVPVVVAALLVWLYRDPRFALFMLLSPLMAISNWLAGRRRDSREGRASDHTFRAAVKAFEQQLDEAAKRELRRRDLLHPDPAETARRAYLPSTQLWQRRPAHEDHLRLRAGIGDVPWTPPVEDSRDEVAPEIRAAIAARQVLPRCPVPVDLSAGGVVGLVGDRSAALALARSLVCQAAVHHGPADLGIAVCTSAEHRPDWEWAKWLPHNRDPGRSTRLLAGDRGAADTLLAGLLGERQHEPPARSALAGRDQPTARTRLLVLDDPSLLEGRRAPARLLLHGAAGPACGIVVAAAVDQLPAVTTTAIEARSELGDADLRQFPTGLRVDGFVIAGLPEHDAGAIARTLARYEDPELEDAGAGVPQLVRLLPLLGMERPDAGAVRRRWAEGLPPSAPIGVGEDGVVWLDLVGDGPHGLIGGTTGSGKSELLRSLVAGLAVRVDPDHLVFVLIDYKGGSAFAECARLPHTVGLVTDLDEHLGERALRSLEAELGHRERILRAAGAADLPAYLRGGAPSGPLPRLVVAIDEFATLAAELPDFLGALVGIAQRGRSLGVHLLLATQRPSGAVNANIKANTNLRIALRVQDAQDSTDIVDRADAAAISRSHPGRAYLRRGHAEVTLVQTALSTATVPSNPAHGVRLLDFRFGPPPPTAPADPPSSPSDLVLLVDAVRAAFAGASLSAPRPPWLPMLGERVDLAGLLAADDGSGTVLFALADDPDRQRQSPCGWNLAEGHLAVFGMVGSGTTTTLLAVARALCERYSPDRCHLYGLDFGAGGLAPLGAFPQVGEVVRASEDEAQVRLVRLLRRELDRRRALPAGARETEPRIVVLIDGIGGFLAEHEDGGSTDTLDAFRRVFSDGPAVGILFVVTGERPGALPPRLGSLIGQRLLLRLADPLEFSGIGLRPRQLPVFVPGRAIHAPSRLVVQIGHPGQDLAAVAQDIRSRWPAPARPPAAIATLADTLPFGALPGGTRLDGSPIEVVLGLRGEDLGPAVLPLHATDHALVAGPPRSGKSSTLVLVAELIRRADPKAVLVGVCDRRSPLHGVGALDAAGPLRELARVIRLADRNPDRLWIVLVDDCPLVEDPEGVLTGALRSGRPGLHVVGAGRSDDLRTSYGHWSRALRQSRNGLLLQPNLTADGELLGVRLPRRPPVPLLPGRGYLVSAGETGLVQIALPPDGTGGSSEYLS